MKKQLFPLALWLFFGFVLINAIDSVLRFIIKAYLYFGLWTELSFNFLKYSIPVLSTIIYGTITVLTIKYIKLRTVDFNIREIKFSKRKYILAVVISIFMDPITNKLSGGFGENIDKMNLDYELSEFLNLYGTTEASLGVIGWLTIIVLSIYFYRIYKKSELETKQ
ncbi:MULTISPECIES: hypothetical protein [Aequorivita]|uniref:DUF2975 domain-containing protein n=1 Tax=Aequorivita iocasae TaxID=2803865 RepID=A0ABX7DST2_9FLAO|nr:MULTISPECIES: hypothetical protein [Aequorivita]QQX77058.1 hypothetical protein JK629_01930 [Aequorivita iocasae]UCA56539.1 hypothetical protein LDL78_01945 [Aequorivita sp. F7]